MPLILVYKHRCRLIVSEKLLEGYRQLIPYIDPGTGAMLFSFATGLLSVAWFGARKLYMGFKYRTGRKDDNYSDSVPLVIFSDDKRYWQVFEPVVRELDARSFPVTYLTASPDDPALSAAYSNLHAEFIGEGNRGYARLNFLQSTMLLSTTPGLDVYQWRRSQDVKCYIHLPHAASDSTTSYRMFGLDFYDVVLYSGQYQEEAMRELERMRGEEPKEAVMVGVPYMDEMIRRLNDAPELPEHVRTVLVAPTWGKNSILNKYGYNFIDKLLLTGYHVILRPHPQSYTAEKELIEALMHKYPDSDRLEWNRDADNFEVLRQSDILISDYSGVIFDFAFVFDKPVICADTDINVDMLDAWWLDRPLWTISTLPKIGPILTKDNIDDLKNLIDSAFDDKSYAASRRQARDETWCYFGEGAKRTADYLICKYKKLTGATDDAEQLERDLGKA